MTGEASECFDPVVREVPEPPWLGLYRAIDLVAAEDAAAAYDRRAEIVRFREQAGLAVDDAVIEDLLARGASGLAHPGMWETGEEAARRQRGQALIDAASDAVDAYTDAHEDTFADSWIEWNDHVPTLVVAFTDEPEPHAAALDHPGVRVTRGARARRELQPVAEEIVMAQLRGEAPAGTMWITAVPRPVDGVIEVIGIGPDERAAAAWLARRYGDLVRLSWQGSAEPRVVAASWQLWEPSAGDPGALTVHWRTNSAHSFDHADVEATSDHIKIGVLETVPAGPISAAGAYRSTELHLDEPVGARAVIDAVTDRPRAQR
jgi:hypothetical protein